jgi:hypothetical protein
MAAAIVKGVIKLAASIVVVAVYACTQLRYRLSWRC